VVVEGATLATLVTGSITMIIVGVFLNVVGLGVFCWALFALAIHALPFFVGMTVGIYSYQAGAGPLGAIVVGSVAGGFALVLWQYAFSVARSPTVRLIIRLLFAVPAARAGYDATLALAHFGIPQGWWRESFAMPSPLSVRALRSVQPSGRLGRRPRAGDCTGLSSLGWDQRRYRFVQHDRDITVLSHTSTELGDLVSRL
jgi:MFS family permease